MILFVEIIFIIFMLWMIFWQGSMLWAGIIGPPIVYSSYEGIRDAFKLAKLKQGETIIDLGCGNGRTLILAVKEFGAKGIGIDRSLFCILKARLNIYLSGESENIKIYFKPFEKASVEIKKSDVIYLYLWPSTLAKIESWLFEQIKPTTRVVSLAFKFAKKKPDSEIETMNLGMKMSVWLYTKK
ncbi:MAG: methyltransferase domain-containing protein [bacterium]|nr:methyltransferase domain-containing protein [bacterium]